MPKLLVGSLAARPSILRLSINDNMKIPEGGAAILRRIEMDGFQQMSVSELV